MDRILVKNRKSDENDVESNSDSDFGADEHDKIIFAPVDQNDDEGDDEKKPLNQTSGIARYANFKKDKPIAKKPAAHTFEEAVSLTEVGKFHYMLLVTCGLCFLTVMSQISCIGVILPNIKCDIFATLKEQGLLASAGFFGVVCSSHAMGFLGDTWGRVQTLKYSLLLSTIVGIISAFSINVWMLIVTRFLTGFFASGCQACVFSLCSEYHSSRSRARHVTLISMFLSGSLVYTAAEALLIIPLKIDFTLFGLLMSPWRFLLLAVNISGIVALVLLYFTPETPKYALIHDDHDGAVNTLRKVFSINTGRPAEEYPVREIQLEVSGSSLADIHGVVDVFKMLWAQTIPMFSKDRVLHTLNICFILFVTYGMSHGLFMWYPTIFNDAIHRDGDDFCTIIEEVDILQAKKSDVCSGKVDSLTFWLLMFVGAVFTVVYLLFAFTINVVGKKNILIIWLLICGACCVAVKWISSLHLAVLALTIISAVGNCAGIVATIAVEFYPTNINTMAMCFIMMMGRLGAVAGSNLFGRFLFFACGKTFMALALSVFVVAFLSWLLPGNRKPKCPCEGAKP